MPGMTVYPRRLRTVVAGAGAASAPDWIAEIFFDGGGAGAVDHADVSKDNFGRVHTNEVFDGFGKLGSLRSGGKRTEKQSESRQQDLGSHQDLQTSAIVADPAGTRAGVVAGSGCQEVISMPNKKFWPMMILLS